MSKDDRKKHGSVEGKCNATAEGNRQRQGTEKMYNMNVVERVPHPLIRDGTDKEHIEVQMYRRSEEQCNAQEQARGARVPPLVKS